MERNVPITIPELDLLNFIGFLGGPPAQNRVIFNRFLRVYIESLHYNVFARAAEKEIQTSLK